MMLPEWPFRMRVKTAEDGRAAVQLLKRRGVDLIKVHNNTPRHAYFAIAEETRREGLPLAGHVPLKVTAEEAIDAGLANIEHLSEMRLWTDCSGGAEYRPEACRPFLEMLARRGDRRAAVGSFLRGLFFVRLVAKALCPGLVALGYSGCFAARWSSNSRSSSVRSA